MGWFSCCCFAFYAYVSGSLCCSSSKNEVIHLPRDEFYNKSWGQTNSWTSILLPLLHGVSGSLSSTGNVMYAERGGKAFGGSTQCKGAPAYIILSLFRTLWF